MTRTTTSRPRHGTRPPLARRWRRTRLPPALGLDGPRRPHRRSPHHGPRLGARRVVDHRDEGITVIGTGPSVLPLGPVDSKIRVRRWPHPVSNPNNLDTTPPPSLMLGRRRCNTRVACLHNESDGRRVAGVPHALQLEHPPLHLHRRALDRSVGAEHAAVSRLRPQQRLALFALVEELTGIGRHGFMRGMAAVRAGQHRLHCGCAGCHLRSVEG